MGTLRLLLAISVVAFHSAPIFGFLGMRGDAVQAFFVLSGFYMALILQSDRYPSALAFYQSRALRLFPVYWVFLLTVVAIAMAQGLSDSAFVSRLVYAARSRIAAATDGSDAAWLTAIPNLLFVGAEWSRQFFYDDTGQIHLWRLGLHEGPNVHAVERHLIAPQIWSLGVELTFYTMAPLLVRLSSRILIVVLVLAYVAGNVVQGVGSTYTGPFAWHHMLPIQNGWLFLLGMLCFRCVPLVRRLPLYANATLALIPLGLVFAWAPSTWEQVNALLVLFALGLPSLFAVTRSWNADRRVGELSYPIYITHFLFAWPALVFGQYAGLVCLAISVVLSLALLRFVQMPIDRLRAQLARPAFA